MPDVDLICKIARKTMVLPTAFEINNNWLWDRTVRCLKNVDMLCRLPELADRANSVDRFCLVSATYFADSGFSQYAQDQVTSRGVPADVNYKKLCGFSTKIVSDELNGLLTDSRIDKICEIITESCNRFTETVEAMILSDARNLEDLGAAGMMNELRHHILCGKGISEIVKSWKRKVEYGYWQARLKEGFRFEAACDIAQKRFEAVENFMAQLVTENKAEDLELYLGQLAGYR